MLSTRKFQGKITHCWWIPASKVDRTIERKLTKLTNSNVIIIKFNYFLSFIFYFILWKIGIKNLIPWSIWWWQKYGIRVNFFQKFSLKISVRYKEVLHFFYHLPWKCIKGINDIMFWSGWTDVVTCGWFDWLVKLNNGQQKGATLIAFL